jgi:hypothetical protein
VNLGQVKINISRKILIEEIFGIILRISVIVSVASNNLVPFAQICKF